MNWLQHHSAQFTLAVASLGLLVSTAYLATTRVLPHRTDWSQSFSSAPEPVAFKSSASDQVLANPAPSQWRTEPGRGGPFVSREYVRVGSQLKLPIDATFHPPVPNRWLIEHGLDCKDPKVLDEDPDGDGFSTLAEWLGRDGRSHLDNQGKRVLDVGGRPLPDDSFDPGDPSSHPPYYTQLVLEQVVSSPLTLRFTTYEQDPAQPGQFQVAINTSLQGGRSRFGAIGSEVEGTPYRIEALRQKSETRTNAMKRDVSELTLVHQKTGRKLVLPRDGLVNAPERSAVMRYRWAPPGRQPSVDGKPTALMTKGCGDGFTLPPEERVQYRVIDIRADEADIQLPDGGVLTLRKTP